MNIEVSKKELKWIVNGLGWLTEETNQSKEDESAIYNLADRLEKLLET